MSGQEPITQAESGALGELGYGWLDSAGRLLAVAGVDAAILRAYRAGFADARKPPEPRVFRAGDPEPGPEVLAVVDRDGDTWHRDEQGRCGEWAIEAQGGGTDWDAILPFAPLVACLPRADYAAAVRADQERRAAGGAG